MSPVQRIGNRVQVVIGDADFSIIENLVQQGVYRTVSEAVRELVHEALRQPH